MQMIWKENRVTKESKETRTDRVWDKIAKYFGYVPKEKCDVLLSHLTETVRLLVDGDNIIARQESAHQLVMQFFTQMGIKSFTVDPDTRAVNHVDFDENIVVNQSLVKALLDFGIEVSIPMQEGKDPLAKEQVDQIIGYDVSGKEVPGVQDALLSPLHENEVLDTPETPTYFTDHPEYKQRDPIPGPEIPTVTPDLSTEPEQTDFSYLSNHPKGLA